MSTASRMRGSRSAYRRSGQWAHYVVTGTARLTQDAQTTEVPTGQLAVTDPDKDHIVANAAEGRLVVLTTHAG